MKCSKQNWPSAPWQFRVAVLLLLTGLPQVRALPQAAASAQASVRGSAKIGGTFPVADVMIVATPHREKGKPTGKPVPAWVNNLGEYRIEDISPGSYDLKAVGKLIKTRVIRGIAIREGGVNIVNFDVERAGPVRGTGKVKDSRGGPAKNVKVAIYSSELPPSVCADCQLAEVTSDENGEVNYGELAGRQSYQVAIKSRGETGPAGDLLIAAETITLGDGPAAEIELRVGDGPQPALMATLLPGPLNPAIQRRNQNEELASNAGDPGRGVDAGSGSTNTRAVASGRKMKVKGVVTRRDIDANTFDVQDANGVITTVALDDRTTVKTKGGFFGGGSSYGASNILRGLNLEVEGRGDEQGRLAATKVRFGDTDLRVAQSIQARVDPVETRVGNAEGRITEVESNSQRLSGQLEELAAVSNAARGGAKAAQETADKAVSGVNATNERIAALDDYAVQQNVSVNFRVGSAVLSPEAKATLDEIAQQALRARGYVVEVRGFASADGGEDGNRRLSQRRADAVVRYLAENHNIPLRRIITPFGYGERQAIADNATREGRQQNRRVEVNVLVNRGLMQQGPNLTPTKQESAPPPEVQQPTQR